MYLATWDNFLLGWKLLGVAVMLDAYEGPDREKAKLGYMVALLSRIEQLEQFVQRFAFGGLL